MRRLHRIAAFALLTSTLFVPGSVAQDKEVERSPIMHVRNGVEKPVRLSGDAPTYSETARKARLQGTVILEAVIDQKGDIGRVRTIKGLPMELTDQAIVAIKTWKYEPATLDGEPVSVYYQVTVNFRLEKGEKEPPAEL